MLQAAQQRHTGQRVFEELAASAGGGSGQKEISDVYDDVSAAWGSLRHVSAAEFCSLKVCGQQLQEDSCWRLMASVE